MLVGDDDSDDSDDGISPSAGPTVRWNTQETHNVTAFCYQQDQQTQKKGHFCWLVMIGDDDSDDSDDDGDYDGCTYHDRA